MKAMLKNKLYLTTFVADMVSNFGDTLYYLALMNYVLQLRQTNLALALITLSETLPILTGMVTGMWADKTKNKVDAILATLGFRAGLYLLVGYAMGFDPALWIVILAVVVNFFSDLSGQYESSLFLPISLRLIADEEREATMAARQGFSGLLRIAFQSSGAFLVTIMGYQHLAFFNAGTFLVSLLLVLVIRPRLQALFYDRPVKVAELPDSDTSFIKDMRKNLKKAFATIREIPILKASIVVIVSLNAIFVGLSPLFVLSISERQDFVVINSSTTLALLSIVAAVGSIVGSFLVATVFREVSLLTLLKVSAVTPAILFIGFFFGHIYFVLLVVFMATALIGAFNPKLNALVLREIPEEHLGTISSGINTVAQIGMIAGQVLTAFLITVLSIQAISLIFFLLAVLLLSYTMVSTKDQEVKEEK